MVDLISSLILCGFAIAVLLLWVLFAVLPKRAANKRLDGHGGIMLGRGIMEVAYRMFGPLVRVLIALHVTPNMVTAFSLVPAVVSAVLIATGHFGLGALLATGSGFCDMIDGILARHYQSGSDVGELFDAAVDRYVEFLLLAGLAVYFRGSPVVIVLCLATVLGAFMVSYTTAKAEALGVPPPKGAMRRAERAVYVIFGCALAPVWELLVPGDRSIAGIAYGRELPMELSLFVVATVANVSAVRRMLRIAQLIREKKPAPQQATGT
jgi:CDP-diacylglycerol---glycerol-3-phosphate 3-phosphatidyltransferase